MSSTLWLLLCCFVALSCSSFFCHTPHCRRNIQAPAVDRLQESAFVPEPPPERSRGRSTSEKSEPKAREVWTQTGFGTPMPRPIVRYGAPKVKAVAGESYFFEYIEEAHE